MISRINKEQSSYELELNQFADLTWEEFKEKYLQKAQKNPWLGKRSIKLKNQPKKEKIDW